MDPSKSVVISFPGGHRLTIEVDPGVTLELWAQALADPKGAYYMRWATKDADGRFLSGDPGLQIHNLTRTPI